MVWATEENDLLFYFENPPTNLPTYLPMFIRPWLAQNDTLVAIVFHALIFWPWSVKTSIKWPTGLITKYSTQSLNIHKAIYMNIHVRVYLLHAYMHSGNFARGWGQGPIFSRGFQLFSGEGGSNCYFIKKRVDFPGWVVRTSCPLWTCAQPIYMCLCIKPLKCSRQYFFLKI